MIRPAGQDANAKKQAFLRFTVGGDSRAKIVLGLSPEARLALYEYSEPDDFVRALGIAISVSARAHWQKLKENHVEKK